MSDLERNLAAAREKEAPELRQARALEQIAEEVTNLRVELGGMKMTLQLVAQALNRPPGSSFGG